MTGEQLFVAIGMVEESCLARCEYDEIPDLVTDREDSKMKINKIWLIAAIVALMVLLMGSAIAALVKMDVVETKVLMREETVVDGETVVVEKIYVGEKVTFEEVHDEFIEMEAYYPQMLPEGYEMTFVSNDAPLQHRVIHFENDAGGLIKYWLYLGDPASYLEIYGIQEKLEVEVNGLPGILYVQEGDTRTLVWADEDKGFGFALRTNDPAVPILPMAESTAQGEELTPTHSAETLQALEELGDYAPEYLPEGYEELEVQGWPIMDDGWYSYVRKWYINKAENKTIYFEYETYKIVTEDGYTDDAKTAASFFIPGYVSRREEIVAQDVEICGMVGIQSGSHIAWADSDTHKVFHIYSENVSGEELLEVARGVARKN